MFDLLPWRWTHWVFLLLGPVFVLVYLTALAWSPMDEALQRIASTAPLGARDPELARAEVIFTVITLALLTPLAAIVTLFLLLFGLVAFSILVGPFVRLLGLPAWPAVVLLAAALSALVYWQREVWLPWSLWLADRVGAVYIILFL
jgi:hypothetical protein